MTMCGLHIDRKLISLAAITFKDIVKDIVKDGVCPIMMLRTMSCCPSDVNILLIMPVISSFRPISCC